MISKSCNFNLKKKLVMLLASPFDIGVDFNFFVGNIMRFIIPWLQKVVFLISKKIHYR
jgi:hypothetical protein